jgi:MATE family multidrug resistance protein
MKNTPGNLWTQEGGYRELLATALPLILSTSSWTIQQIVDRIFLTWYSPAAIAAAMPAAILNFTLMTFFMGTAGYVNTFIAQYHGARCHGRVGPVLWQGIYISLAGGLLIMLTVPFARAFFAGLGHAAEVQEGEVVYYQIMSLGVIPPLVSNVLSCFWSGRGETWPLFWANIAGTAVNVVLDYVLIFGKFGFPEMGIKGAAIATVIAGVVTMAYYVVNLYGKRYVRRYHLFRDIGLQPKLLARLWKFGAPSGLQFFLDVLGWSAAILIIGRLGTASLAATNIAFNINTIAFMPMIGFGIAVSILVGQYLGRDKPKVAERAVWLCFGLTFAYMSAVAVLYFFFPGLFLSVYAQGADAAETAAILATTALLLKFIAVYSLFDTMNIVFISALKGAGDTMYIMVLFGIAAVGLLIVPVWMAVAVFHWDIFAAWWIITVYIAVLGLLFLARFVGGKWKSMRVIEPNLVSPGPCPPT